VKPLAAVLAPELAAAWATLAAPALAVLAPELELVQAQEQARELALVLELAQAAV
jgi:hypothetical protein